MKIEKINTNGKLFKWYMIVSLLSNKETSVYNYENIKENFNNYCLYPKDFCDLVSKTILFPTIRLLVFSVLIFLISFICIDIFNNISKISRDDIFSFGTLIVYLLVGFIGLVAIVGIIEYIKSLFLKENTFIGKIHYSIKHQICPTLEYEDKKDD